MLRTQINNQHFTGYFETNKKLASKLDNVKELNKLAEVANVDKIRTYIKDDSKYLPKHNSFITLTSKKVNNRFVHGLDCIILDKNTDNKTLSKKVYESAQQSIGKMYGNIAKNLSNSPEQQSTKIVSNFTEICSKLLNWFKK